MEYEISNRLSGVHGSMIRELFKFGASKDIISSISLHGNVSADGLPPPKDIISLLAPNLKSYLIIL